MFYESIGALLRAAADDLAADDAHLPADERVQRERRQITKLLRRIGVIWPELFRALEEESAILEATLRSAANAVQAHRQIATEPGASGAVTDPLARYRGLLRELDEIVILLHEHSRQPWAQDALRALRRGLADAADVQGRLVDEMLTV